MCVPTYVCTFDNTKVLIQGFLPQHCLGLVSPSMQCCQSFFCYLQTGLWGTFKPTSIGKLIKLFLTSILSMPGTWRATSMILLVTSLSLSLSDNSTIPCPLMQRIPTVYWGLSAGLSTKTTWTTWDFEACLVGCIHLILRWFPTEAIRMSGTNCQTFRDVEGDGEGVEGAAVLAGPASTAAGEFGKSCRRWSAKPTRFVLFLEGVSLTEGAPSEERVKIA